MKITIVIGFLQVFMYYVLFQTIIYMLLVGLTKKDQYKDIQIHEMAFKYIKIVSNKWFGVRIRTEPSSNTYAVNENI